MKFVNAETAELETFAKPPSGGFAVLLDWVRDDQARYHPDKACELREQTQAIIQEACRVAISQRVAFVWSCIWCVDWSSSAEVSQALTSLPGIYRSASVCYNYLEDLPCTKETYFSENVWRQSKWFTRGWTLQELILPPEIQFYDAKWHYRGEHSEKPLLGLLWTITGIDEEALLDHNALKNFSVARIMSWAINKFYLNQEDKAYALMGLFGIQIPVIYGEGGPDTFRRLQESILRNINDKSLLGWTRDQREDAHDIFANQLEEFADFGKIQVRPIPWASGDFVTWTSRGILISSAFIQRGQDLVFQLSTENQFHGGVELLGIVFRQLFNSFTSFARVEPWQLTSFSLNEKVIYKAILFSTTSKHGENHLMDQSAAIQFNALVNGDDDDWVFVETGHNEWIESVVSAKSSVDPDNIGNLETDSLYSSEKSLNDTKNLGMNYTLPSPQERSETDRGGSILPETSLTEQRDFVVLQLYHYVWSRLQKNINMETDSQCGRNLSESYTEEVKQISKADGWEPGLIGSEAWGKPGSLTYLILSTFLQWRKATAGSLLRQAERQRRIFTRHKRRRGKRHGILALEHMPEFACPFFANDPAKWQSCLAFHELRTIDAVKSHLWEHHRRPYYCPTCYSTFELAALRDRHMVSRSCTAFEDCPLEGISENQKQEIRRGINGLKARDQWDKIYAILFGRQSQPISPYLDCGHPEEVSELRSFWFALWQEVVQRTLNNIPQNVGLPSEYDLDQLRVGIRNAITLLILRSLSNDAVGGKNNTLA